VATVWRGPTEERWISGLQESKQSGLKKFWRKSTSAIGSTPTESNYQTSCLSWNSGFRSGMPAGCWAVQLKRFRSPQTSPEIGRAHEQDFSIVCRIPDRPSKLAHVKFAHSTRAILEERLGKEPRFYDPGVAGRKNTPLHFEAVMRSIRAPSRGSRARQSARDLRR